MTDLPATPRFAFPLLAVGQAQKEVTHNEALMLIDVLVQAAVVAGPMTDPPVAAVTGQCWLVGAAASGAWAGQATKVALWTAGGWRFVAPREGMRLVRTSDGAVLRFDGSAWVPPASVTAPSGGAVIDVEARSALAALMLLLDAHGLMISA